MISMPTLRTTGSSKPLVAAELSREQQVLKDCYIRYSPYGEMDGKTFFKVAKDAKHDVGTTPLDRMVYRKRAISPSTVLPNPPAT